MTDYVTHAEFGAAMSKIDERFKQAATKSDVADVKAEVHKMDASIKTWMLATVLTIIGTMLAAIFGVAQVMKPAAQAQQPPIVISVPSAPPAIPSPGK